MTKLILVVDDDNFMRMHLCKQLTDAGYQVEEASNGLEAIAIYTRLHPDIVLLDIMMPVMDGFSCCAQLQALSNGKNTPVLMISAFSDQATVDKAFALGATDFITKPIQWPILHLRLRRLLEAHHAIQELRQQATQAQLREVELRMALDAARMGTWNWDLLTNKITCSDNLEALFGLEKGTFNYTYQAFLHCIHPHDRDFVRRSHQQAVEDKAKYEIEFRVILPNGKIRFLANKGVVLVDTSGMAVQISGVYMDITKRRQAEKALEVHANQQAMVAELSQMALAGADLTTLMNSSVTIVAQCLKVEFCKILELLPGDRKLLLRAGVGWQPGLVGKAIVSGERNSQAGYTLLSKEPVIVDDLRTETRFNGPPLLHEHQVVSGISVVIYGKERPFGVFGAHTTRHHTFTKDDISLLQAVANVLATAIERQRMEDALKESEERCQLAVQGNNDGIWDWNVKNNQVYFSTRWKEMLGYAEHEISNNLDEWATRVHPDDIGFVRQAIADHFAQITPFFISEHRVRCKDDTYKWVLDRGQAVWDEDGNVVRMTSCHTDITERKLAEEQLRQSEERFQIVARATNDLLWDWDLLTDEVWWNQALEKLLGYSKEQITFTAQWWYEHIHPDDRQRIASQARTLIDSGEKFWSNEYRFRHSDGSYAYMFDRGYVVHDQTGKPVRMMGAMMDISERQAVLRDRDRAQAALELQNLRSQLFANITLKIRQSLQIDEILQTSVKEVQKLLLADRVLILRLQPNGSFMAVQEAVVPGLPVVLGEQIIDPCFRDDYVVQYRQGRISIINNIKEADIQPCHIELLERFAVKANLVVPICLKNQMWGLLIAHQCAHPRQWTSWEIELLRQLADQIGIASTQSLILEQETRHREELTRSNEELKQFAFVASHDLQEPLRKIKSFGDRLKSTCGDTLSEQGRDYLERMQNAASRMQTLIEDLLTLSRVTTRAQPFVSVNLTKIAQEVLSDLEIYVQQTGGSVEIGELPTIQADPIQMRQLLQNLIGNALKFHRPQIPPVIKIYSKILNNQADNISSNSELCQIIVEDNGIGFEEKYLDRIFNVFQRLHSSIEYEGTGIGLAICRKIIERHHGHLTAQSKPGQGAKFTILLSINSHS
ncbi:PAS domain-containing protein [Nostoc sp. UCD121]|uniref:PAS domain-containing protein n=1 Tax=unclassified Nostoc TaxID=2593658 RepID=UPI0016299B4A|nr:MULTISPECIES: PAS domain-containing protein [unclassified Nostoc]MBC1219303.1 PAS domain-containing protein [Nostoc sp. UCD120]MBC1279276.1 PAS domain-containing protein [Nostoc sp. UCD121]MBC1295764.1 PAS domain-containing protein [Nostoc sp. UCD122]